MKIKDGLSLDDLLLLPKYSTITSRSDVDVSVELAGMKYKHPIIPANMKTIMSEKMAWAVAQSGGLAILHRFDSLENQLDLVNKIISNFGYQFCAASIGVQKQDYENIPKFINFGVRLFCIDVAHCDSSLGIDMIKNLKNNYHDLKIIAGNVATESGAYRLWESGADICKIFVGSGSLCTTRIETGNGSPTFTCLNDVASAQAKFRSFNNNKNCYFIADGGMKNSGDVVKCLCFADMTMLGNVFSGCEETPGEMININGENYKSYVGSSTHKTNHIEGVAALVKPKGSFNSILENLLQGLRSGCSYQNAHNLKKLKEDPEFVKITPAGLRESHPHSVDKIIK